MFFVPRISTILSRVFLSVAAVGCGSAGARDVHVAEPSGDHASQAASTRACAGGSTEACQAACEEGGAAECVRLGELTASQRKRGAVRFRDVVKAHKRACDLGAGRGCLELGSLLEHGVPGVVARDVPGARAAYERACSAADAGGCGELGRVLLYGIGGKADATRGAALLSRACDADQHAGCSELAFAIAFNRTPGHDLAEAATLLVRTRPLVERRCRERDLRACTLLGNFMQPFGSSASDPEWASALLSPACEGGVADACGILGMYYMVGQGVGGIDEARAGELSRDSCNDGSALGCTAHGAILIRGGRGAAPQVKQGIAIMQQACENAPRFCTTMGALYQAGRGVPKNAVLAASNFRQACEHGDMVGCDELAKALLSGTGVRRDEEAGLALLRGTCALGSQSACEATGKAPPSLRVQECNALIEVINVGVQNLGRIKPDAKGDPSGTSELKEMADQMDRVAAACEQVNLTFTELRIFSAEYQYMAREVSRSARAMAEATSKKDSAALTRAQTALDKAVKVEDPLVDRINKFCQAP